LKEPAGIDSKKEESGMEPKDDRWDIRDPGAAEVPAYIPTKYEITELVKHWYGRFLSDLWQYFNTSVASSSGMRLKRYADYRMGLAEKAIGFDAVEEAVQEVLEELREKVNNERLWTIFMRGTPEQREAVWEENLRKFTEDGAADVIKHLEQLKERHPDESVVLVLQGSLAKKNRAVLISSAADPELFGLLQAGGRLEIETDRSKIKTLIVDQRFDSPGCLRVSRHEGSWMVVESASDLAGGNERKFLEGVASQVRELLRDGTARNSREQ
jgi:hypothetical protein